MRDAGMVLVSLYEDRTEERRVAVGLEACPGLIVPLFAARAGAKEAPRD